MKVRYANEMQMNLLVFDDTESFAFFGADQRRGRRRVAVTFAVHGVHQILRAVVQRITRLHLH